MASTTASRKAKGRRLQDCIRDRLREIFNLGEGDIDSQIMGMNGLDIRLSPKAQEVFPYGIEAKNTERVSLRTFWQQCVSNASRLEPLLFLKSNRQETLVVMKAEHFFNLIEERYKNGKKS